MISSTCSTVERRTLPTWFYSTEPPSSSDSSRNPEPVEAENESRTSNENVTDAAPVEAVENEILDDQAVDSTSESNAIASDVPIPSPDSSLVDNIPSNADSVCDNLASDNIPPNVDSVCDNPASSSSPPGNVITSNSEAPKRPPCCFGTACYRRNVQHKAEFSHPTDADYEPEEVQCSSSTDVNGNKPACWYGTRCYRKNKEHLEAFSHDFTPSGRPKRSTTRTHVEMGGDSDESDELDDFSESDEYEASFIDDDNNESEDFESEDETPSEISDNSNASADEDDSNKKRKKKARNTKKKKRKESLP